MRALASLCGGERGGGVGASWLARLEANHAAWGASVAASSATETEGLGDLETGNGPTRTSAFSFDKLSTELERDEVYIRALKCALQLNSEAFAASCVPTKEQNRSNEEFAANIAHNLEGGSGDAGRGSSIPVNEISGAASVTSLK